MGLIVYDIVAVKIIERYRNIALSIRALEMITAVGVTVSTANGTVRNVKTTGQPALLRKGQLALAIPRSARHRVVKRR